MIGISVGSCAIRFVEHWSVSVGLYECMEVLFGNAVHTSCANDCMFAHPICRSVIGFVVSSGRQENESRTTVMVLL